MTLLVLGLAMWVGAHMFKRVAPERRAAMQDRLGKAAKGVFASILVLSVILMVWGYRAAPFVSVYEPPVWTAHVMPILMIVAIALFGLGSSKSSLRGRLRHPQLLGFALWAGLHLTVNGDAASLLLFGTLLVWALVEMAVISAQDPAPAPYTVGTTAGTIRLLVITVVLYILIVAVHTWLGVNPFG